MAENPYPFKQYDPNAPLDPVPPADGLEGRTAPVVLPTIIGNAGLNPELEP